MTIFPQEEFAHQAKWFNIQNNMLNEIHFGGENTRQTFGGRDKPTPQKIVINNIENKFGAYQLRLNNMVSNKINVFNEGTRMLL